MKFRIAKGTSVAAHIIDTGWTLGPEGDFIAIKTDVNVVFTEEDVWFIPGGLISELKDANPYDLCKHIEEHYFGFIIPENKKNIDVIVANKTQVDIEREQSISEDKKILRRIRQQGGKHWFPGKL